MLRKHYAIDDKQNENENENKAMKNIKEIKIVLELFLVKKLKVHRTMIFRTENHVLFPMEFLQ